MYRKPNVPLLIRILAFGEILWDMLPAGKKLGGAPVNFLYHAKTLGANVRSLTRIGNDLLGRELLEQLKKLDLSTEFLQITTSAPTGTVDVSLDSTGNPAFHIVENVAWDAIGITPSILESSIKFLTSPNVVSALYFGSLALRTEKNIDSLSKLLLAIPDSVLRVCDLNLRKPFYNRETIIFALTHADVVKLNDNEAILLDTFFADKNPQRLSLLADNSQSLNSSLQTNLTLTTQTLRNWASYLLDAFSLQSVIVTCGANGAFFFNQSGFVYSPSKSIEVKDTVGAGDSFAAVCVYGILKGIPTRKIVEEASKRAAFVCSQSGGTPHIPHKLCIPFDNDSNNDYRNRSVRSHTRIEH